MKRILPLFFLLLLLSAGAGFAQTGGFHADGSEHVATEDAPVFIPNAFTPNDDGVNDVFYIPDANLTKFDFSFFDRWGNRVYHTNKSDFRWNGSAKGRTIPTGIYVFVLDAATANNTPVKRSGTITVVR